jgi:hypothetical protein
MSNYPLRLPEALMDDVRVMAEAQGVSINQFLATVIAERVGDLKALGQSATRATPSRSVRRRGPRQGVGAGRAWVFWSTQRARSVRASPVAES